MLPIRRAIWLCALVGVSAQYDCGLCPASGSPCCDCCVGGGLQAGLCNSVAYLPCLPPACGNTQRYRQRRPLCHIIGHPRRHARPCGRSGLEQLANLHHPVRVL